MMTSVSRNTSNKLEAFIVEFEWENRKQMGGEALALALEFV